ncbi:DUF1542 domain-containing protein [Streptococcus suis]|uniref:DUF1542 domain-containing protein n=1 Tax=Streptococcus suis TaxID=1307 RepID=UPI001C97A671|nr:DUF1542 domain-containing protein [Streptococcus suis]MBY5017119.1 DUF1542 domain-containing protein [Streptococcus suis]
MSSKDMFRKEQRFSFRKFSFGLASAVIANVIFGGAIANSPVVHANTTTETAAVATSERIASIPYTVNIVDQTGKVVETKEKKVLVYTVETIATATEYLTADLVPEGYAIVSGLGEVTLTEKAENVFTVKVDKIAPEAVATTTTAESATSETSTAAATPEPASLAATQSTPVTSEVAEAEVAPTTSEESAKPTERTVYLSYITHYVNEANETVDRTGHLVAVTTTDETAKTQVTVSASENMPSGWELVQDKAKVVVQLVENQTNILVFAVTKKSKEEEIAESQLSNRDVLMRLSLEADLLADEALRQVAKEQAGNTALETAANETKAVAATANEVLANDAATEAELDDQIDTVRTSTQNLAAEMLKVDKDGILTAMLDATTSAITITTSSKGKVRPNYADHIRDFANPNQQNYNNQDFFFGLIGKALTQKDSQIRATAEAADGSNPSISLVGGGGQPLTDANNYGLQINNSGVIYGTTTITEPGNAFSWQFKASSNGSGEVSKFTFVPYTVVKTDEEPVRKAVSAGVTADEILAKVKSDVTRGDGSTQGPLNATFEDYFNTTLTARATGKSTTVTADAKTGKQIWHEIKQYVKVAEANGTAVSGGEAVIGSLPTEAGTYDVTVLSTNVHGQTIENTVKVVLNAAPTITASGTGSTNPFNNTNPERKIVYIFGITTGDTEAVTTAKAETGEKAKAPIFDSTIAKPVATITDPDSTSIKVNYGDGAPLSRLNNLGSKMVATAADGTVLKATDGTFTNVTVTNGTANIYLGGTYDDKPGGKYTRQFIISDESGTEVKGDPFYTVSYTDKLVDDQPIAKNQDVALTDTEVFAKLTLDAQSGGFSDTNPNLTVPVSEVTRTIVGYRTADGVYTEQTNLAQFPKDKDFEVKVKTTNVYGQTIYNWVKVDYNLKPKVEIVDAVEGTTKTVYVFSKNNDRTENSEGVTGTNVAFDRNKATKAVVNITDDGQVTTIVYNDAKNDTADMLDKGVTPTTLVGTDGYFTGSVAVSAGTNATRVLKVIDDKGLEGRSPVFRMYAFSDTVPADVTPVKLAKGNLPDWKEITGKMEIDSNSGYPRNAKVAIPDDAYTRTIVGYRLDGAPDTVAVDSVEDLPTDGSYKVRVKTSNAYGQEIYNWVPVSYYKLEEVSRDTVNKYTDFPGPIHTITEVGSTGTVGTVKLVGDLPADFNIANFNLKAGEADKLAERNLEFVKADSLGADGTVGTIRTKDGGKVEYTGSGNLEYVFEYTYQYTYKENNVDKTEEKTSNLTYGILYKDTQAPVMTPKSEYIRFVNEKYDISVPGTDNAFLKTSKIDGTLSVLKPGDSGLVSPSLGTGTSISSSLNEDGYDKVGVDTDNNDQNFDGETSTKFNVNITGTAPSAEGTGTYKLRVGENNYPAPPTVSNKPENVRLTDIKVTFVKRAEMTTPVAVVDPANLTADEKAAVIAQLKKDNADNEKLNALPDTAFTVNADGTVSVDYSAGNTGVDAVTDKVANATVKLADEQKKAKDAIDTKLAEEKAAIEAKRDEAIAEINNTPGLTDDQKKAATDAVTNTANDALTDLQTAADDAKKAIDTETTVAGINDAKTAGEKALGDATATGEAAIELTKEKELAKADVDNQAKAAIEAIKNNPNLNEDEQAPYIDAIEKAAEEQKAAIDAAKDTVGITEAVDAAEKVNEEQQLAAAKEDAKDKIAEEAAAAKDAIDNNPNLSDAEKTAAKNAVDTEVAKANDAIDKATTPETVQAAEDNGVKAIDAEELVAAKQDAKNKIAEDVKAAKDAIDKDPNLSEDEKKGFKDAVDTEAAKAVADIEKATTPAEAQTAEEAGTAAIAEDVLDAAKQDAKNKIAKDVEAANAAIESNPNLSEDEKQTFKDAVDAEAAKANKAIDAAKTPEAAQAAEEAGTAAIAEDVLDAAKQDAKNKIAKDLATVEAAIDANSNLSQDEKDAAKLAAQAKAAEAVANIEKAATPEAVQTLEDAAVKDLANIEIKAAYDDAVKAIEAADNLSTAAKTQALEDLKKARQAAEEAIKTATTADEVAKGALDGLKSIAKVEAKAAADDAKAAIAQNSNLTDAEKKVYTDAIDEALKDTETKIDAATDADTVDAETVLAQKDIAKQEVAAATADAVKGIEANTNLTDDEKAEYKANVAKAAETAEKAITDATTAADIQSKTFDATQDVAKEEVKADAADAIAGIKANDNLSDTAKEEAIAAIEEARDTTLENIENAKTAADVDAATLDAEKANAKAEIKAAADDAKKAIDENANLPASDKNALKLAIDAEVAATNLEIDNAKTAEEIDAATLATEKSIAKAEVKAAAEDALQAIDENANLTDDEKAKAKADVYVELSKAEKAIDKATTADAIDNATLVGEKAFAKEELEAAADDAKAAIDANDNLTDAEKQAAKDAVDAELAKAKEAVVAAKTADEVDAATLVGEKAIAKEEIKAVAEDAKKAIDANSNLTDDEKAAAKAAVDTEVAKANEAIDKAATADAVDTATLVGEKAVAKEELKAAADDAKKAIDENANLTPEEKAAAKKAVDAEVAKANDAIDKAATADAVDTATLAGEKAVAKEEVKAAAEDAKKAIDANANLPESEKTALKLAIDAEVAATNLEIDNAKTAEEIDAATLVGEKAVAKEEVKAAAEDALRAIDENANLTDDEKAAAKADVYVELSKAEKAIDKATTADAIDNATLVGEKAFAKEELEAAADDAKKAIDANDNLTPEEKATAKAAVDAEVAKANDAIDAATKADEVDAATLAGEKAVAKEELKAAAEDAKAAIDANDNLTDAEKAAAKDAVDAEVAKANEAIDAATKADEVDAATLAGEKAVAKEELKAAVEDAKKAIDANDNLTDAEKAAAKDAVDAEVAKANEAIDAATKADEVDAATLAGEKAVAKEELKAAADDAKAAIDANDNLTDAEKQAAKDAVDAEVAKANEAIDAATKADEVDAATLVGEKAFATAELEAAADDAKKAIDANDNLTDAEKAAAKKAVDDEAAKAEEAIDAATKADEVDAATLAGEKAVAKEELKAAAEDAKKAIDAAKQGAKNKLMEEAEKAKAAIDANPNLTPEEKAAAKAEIDKAVEEAIISINGAGTHHALGEIKLPLSALIKPVVTVTPVLDPNNLTEEEIARIKALLEENNTFPEGTEIIVSKGASVSIKYPDGSIDVLTQEEVVRRANTAAPQVTVGKEGSVVVTPSKEAVELIITYVDNNGKAQLAIVTKGADGKWTTTDKVVIVDPIAGHVIIPGSAIKPGTVVTAYSKDMAGNVSGLGSAEVEAVDANNPAAGVKVKSAATNANKADKKAKQLPNTGEKATSATSLGLAVLGMGLALFAAKRKKDEEEA